MTKVFEWVCFLGTRDILSPPRWQFAISQSVSEQGGWSDASGN
jgi:hypothetical protein